MKKRDSSLELLRIVSMLMVLTVHFVGAAFGLPTPEELNIWQIRFRNIFWISVKLQLR